MRTFAATSVFDDMVHELATGRLQAGADHTPGHVTIGWGRKDRLLLARQAYRAKAAVPDAELLWFDKSGHFPHLDQPQQAVEAILQRTG